MQSPQDYFWRVNNQIKIGELSSAYEILEEFFAQYHAPEFSPEHTALQNDFLTIISNYRRIFREKMTGLIRRDEANLDESRATQAIQYLLKSLEDMELRVQEKLERSPFSPVIEQQGDLELNIKIDGSYPGFGPNQEAEICEAIGERLNIPPNRIRISAKASGSVILTVSLPKLSGLDLFKQFEEGQLTKLGQFTILDIMPIGYIESVVEAAIRFFIHIIPHFQKTRKMDERAYSMSNNEKSQLAKLFRETFSFEELRMLGVMLVMGIRYTEAADYWPTSSNDMAKLRRKAIDLVASFLN